MKKTIFLTLGAAALFCLSQAKAQMLLINEVYPGGGSSSATAAYTRDFVELYNTSATPFSLAGYALQYSAAGATSDFTGTIVSFGTGSIIGGNDYLSIYTGTAGTGGATLTAGTGAGSVTYVAPANSASLAAASGSVRLINLSTNVVLDLVGYGTITASTLNPAPTRVEGTAAATPTSIAVSLNRTNFVDTNNNAADFTSMTPSPNAGTTSVVFAGTVPEPSTYAMMGLGIFGMFAMLRARRRTA